jgi:hypothetical protein
MIFAMRFYTLDCFSMTVGVSIPVSLDLMLDVLESLPRLTLKPPGEAADDPRFAEAIYRAAIAHGVMERVIYQDLPSEAA